jgi:hypothetical protein
MSRRGGDASDMLAGSAVASGAGVAERVLSGCSVLGADSARRAASTSSWLRDFSRVRLRARSAYSVNDAGSGLISLTTSVSSTFLTFLRAGSFLVALLSSCTTFLAAPMISSVARKNNPTKKKLKDQPPVRP